MVIALISCVVGDGEADGNALRLCTDHPAGRGAVPVQPVVLAPERGGRAERLPIDDIGDVADHRGIEDRMHRVTVVVAALMPAAEPVAAGHFVCGGHALLLAKWASTH
jgi:hypothetical protein